MNNTEGCKGEKCPECGHEKYRFVKRHYFQGQGMRACLKCNAYYHPSIPKEMYRSF